MIDNTQMDKLSRLLDLAQQLAGEYTGGFSNNFLSAEEFHAALAQSVQQLKEGNQAPLKQLLGWFAPTCDWDYFIGMEGVGLGQEIFELLCEMVKD